MVVALSKDLNTKMKGLCGGNTDLGHSSVISGRPTLSHDVNHMLKIWFSEGLFSVFRTSKYH